jgi:hypothetical protein
VIAHASGGELRHHQGMINQSLVLGVLVSLFTGASEPVPVPQSVEQACTSTQGRVQDARVRVAWTPLPTADEGVQISYCILRGEKNAKLEFERDAEIVYFALAGETRNAARKLYVFSVKTSEGRIIKQGPAALQPVAKQPQSCRVEVCQFFTNPGERVIQVTVVTSGTRKR